jgi:hypothetical protein
LARGEQLLFVLHQISRGVIAMRQILWKGSGLESGYYRGNHILRRGEHVPGGEPEDPVTLEHQVVLLSSILSKGVAIGVVTLTVECYYQSKIPVHEVNPSDQSSVALCDVDLRRWEFDSGSKHDSGKLSFELAFGERRPPQPIAQHSPHRAHTVAAPARDPMELLSDRSISRKAGSHGFVEAAARETIAPRNSDINEEADNCCAGNTEYLGDTASDQIGGAMNDMSPTGSPFVRCGHLDRRRTPRQSPDMGSGGVRGDGT